MACAACTLQIRCTLCAACVANTEPLKRVVAEGQLRQQVAAPRTALSIAASGLDSLRIFARAWRKRAWHTQLPF